MATEGGAKKWEWLVVIPDFPNTKAKRLEVRKLHFAGVNEHKESGRIKTGGAILNAVPPGDTPADMDFAGSTMVIEAASREEVLEHLNKDIYATSGVWDVGKVQMWPFLCAFRNP